jgi:hypothetical protein
VPAAGSIGVISLFSSHGEQDSKKIRIFDGAISAALGCAYVEAGLFHILMFRLDTVSCDKRILRKSFFWR